MQPLLHDAISGGQHCCQGLLAGSGNMIEKNLAVTQTSHSGGHSTEDFLNFSPFSGIYISTCGTCTDDSSRIHNLVKLVQKYHHNLPVCYLLLELSHKGRVDARLFADAELGTPIPLDLQEDGDLYPAAVNR
ncbi:MAG: hypothetical protein Q9M08_03065 [Mariprofundus sp.]|nr:hypothetical protein [Mariprofundus sp.]